MQMNTLKRTSVIYKQGYYTTQGYRYVTTVAQSEEAREKTLDQLFIDLDKRVGEQWALQDIQTTLEIDELVEDIRNGKAVGVSDGSFKDEIGTAAWIIENASGTQRIMGRVHVPCHPSDQSAYRSEIAGLYAMVMVAESIKKTWALKEGNITIGCDGLISLNEAFEYVSRPTLCCQQQFDLLSGIQGYLRQSELTYIPKHVKGHQDNIMRVQDLGRLEKLNVEVDHYAKEHWAKIQMGTGKYFKYNIPKGMWKISLLGTRICNKLIKELKESIEGGKVAEYWICKKKRISEKGYFMVDWEANQAAMKSVPQSKRQWVTKFESGICGTGRMMKLWKQRVIDNCP